MPLPCRGWTLALLTLLVGFLIFADISEIEEESGPGLMPFHPDYKRNYILLFLGDELECLILLAYLEACQ
ncbi:hypothetical protein llap_17759 [Limosa lapponica baueri]|uniref:Uncharacterized protein n=1 Tax=Limosa lapponica baueri TaxID=1758121 RepID=A0A2I0TDQ1_LIMLA|nr:hypothetical protein llap_17759 [Limosa lapponica baueri]